MTIGAPYFDYSVDSQMVMKNQPMTLPAGGTTGFSYAVSLVTPVNQLAINPPKTVEHDGSQTVKIAGTWVDTEAGQADLYYQIGAEPFVKFASGQENVYPGNLNSFEVNIPQNQLDFDTKGQANIKFKAINLTSQRESPVSETLVQLLKKKLSVNYYFEDSTVEIAPGQAAELFAGTAYDYPPLAIPGYIYDYTYGQSAGVVKDQDIAISHHYLTDHYELDVSGSLPDKTPAVEAKQGQEITYTLRMHSKVKQKGKTYQEVAFNATLPGALTAFKDVTFSYVDDNDQLQKAGQASINEQQLVTTLVEPKISATQDLIVSFKAKVKPETPVGQGIAVAFDVTANCSDGTELLGKPSIPFETTVLESPLELVSVPGQVDFGEVHLNGKTQRVSLKGLDQDVQVQDLLVGRKWQLTVELTKEFTGSQSQQEILGLMKFKQGETVTALSLGNQVNVASQQTESESLVNISKEWVAQKEGFVLDFSDDDSQYTEDDYGAKLTWHLIQGP